MNNIDDFDVEKVETFKNGDTRSIKRYKNGFEKGKPVLIKHGLWQSWFNNGKQRTHNVWVDGKKIG